MALDNGDLGATRDYLFSFRAMDFTLETVPAAMGLALLTLGVGAG